MDVSLSHHLLYVNGLYWSSHLFGIGYLGRDETAECPRTRLQVWGPDGARGGQPKESEYTQAINLSIASIG